MKGNTLDKLLTKIRSCTKCANYLPCKPRPIIQAGTTSRLLIIGQAPGRKANESGVPWDDYSGDRLRKWLNLEKDTFYNPNLITIMPMGLCYPGIQSNGGDKPPRVECQPLWHPPLLKLIPNISLTLLIGWYAQRHYLQGRHKKDMRQTVFAWKEYLPHFIPLPHPSWRNTKWLKDNAWFENELIPFLQKTIRKMLQT